MTGLLFHAFIDVCIMQRNETRASLEPLTMYPFPHEFLTDHYAFYQSSSGSFGVDVLDAETNEEHT